MDIDKLFQSKTFKFVTLGIFVFIILLLVFRLGVMVGFQKANFSYQWGENYHKNFAGPRGGFMNDLEREDFVNRDFIDSHGTVGEIIKIDGENIIVKGKDNVEKIVITKNNSSIVRFKDTIKISDLKVGDIIVVIGDANDKGQIEANLIRTMPKPEMSQLNIPNQPGLPPIK
ncbi:MAG: hypothetical protein PHZ07_04105 [Patescibacteria group bacterium]|nr:hypothetical protein [Patescibacteria group bacterium]MDD4304495.1 hypothetical protein [Patescibacteria group bacterium]MDD4694855.1 hypothetical protein [Patescibacteria group bacterium]